MKKILIALLTVLMLTGCTATKQEGNIEVVQPIEEIEIIDDVTGGWTINTSLPEMNDADFNIAREKLLGVNYSPLFILGTQPSANNTKYLCYATTVTPNATPEYKIVTIHKDYDDPTDCEIVEIEDFNLLNYLLGEGNNTPEGLMGGWQDSTEFPNMLSDDEQVIFDKALEGLTGVGYTPIATLATQLVSGRNYAFLVTGKVVVPNAISHLYIIKVYADLNGNVKLENICGINISEIESK